MPLLNFQKQFAPDVEELIKRQTIRVQRKYPIKPGDTLYLYTGLRTKSCRKLGEVLCLSAEPIIITVFGINIIRKTGIEIIRTVNGLTEQATNDGFQSWWEMADWFQKTHGLPFKGQLIKW